MSDVLFSALSLDPKVEKAIEAMGFATATPVQAESIPLIRTGVDVIAKSQTGTGKTMAFAIPALEVIDTKEPKAGIQVLILCPTRELAQQAGEEIRKAARFMTGLHIAEVYGGADMERQFIQLRRANLVVGTPGRVMDHMRRGSIKLEALKMIVLDEADEMLEMGFKEDIETILTDTPAQRQTVLFSATMPPAILALTKQFQKNPQMIEINKSQVTILNIDQSYVDVPLGKKVDALNLLLRFHRPNRALIFCNTKHMVDELAEHLNNSGFNAESIHGDLKQAQRTRVMNGFKAGKISILIATDVAARGIDVNDVDYVINYDIPQKTEYYVHRIGRTGRAGKSGAAITLCCGRRQVGTIRTLAKIVKSDIREDKIPGAAAILAQDRVRQLTAVEETLTAGVHEDYAAMVSTLVEQGHTAEELAAALLQLHFPAEAVPSEIATPVHRAFREREERGYGERAYGDRPRGRDAYGDRDRAPRTGVRVKRVEEVPFAEVVVDIGAEGRVAPKHLVGAITERSGLSGSQVGKIEIMADHSIVGVPADRLMDVVEAMKGCKICGRPTHTEPLATGGHKPRGAHNTAKPTFFATQRIAKREPSLIKDPVRKRPKAD